LVVGDWDCVVDHAGSIVFDGAAGWGWGRRRAPSGGELAAGAGEGAGEGGGEAGGEGAGGGEDHGEGAAARRRW
jgi:hypothetical protein